MMSNPLLNCPGYDDHVEYEDGVGDCITWNTTQGRICNRGIACPWRHPDPRVPLQVPKTSRPMRGSIHGFMPNAFGRIGLRHQRDIIVEPHLYVTWVNRKPVGNGDNMNAYVENWESYKSYKKSRTDYIFGFLTPPP